MNEPKSKVTLYMRPALHKLLKLRSVEMDMKMSELAELLLERYLLESRGDELSVCPNCHTEIKPTLASKLSMASA